ncbi:hypothetical protein WJX74_000809 [Apatococcus lobatus]|uniref:Uncharacterized protein n=2 Tax=Apatococcus TaxID=904362 RepID=A0AAW1T7X9_9CHLO
MSFRRELWWVNPWVSLQSLRKPSTPLFTKSIVSSPQLRRTSLRASEQEEAEAAKARNPLKPEQPKEEPQLGLVGTIITWGFLAFLFAGSIFFTTARSFLPDMQPLDPNSPALMDQSD